MSHSRLLLKKITVTKRVYIYPFIVLLTILLGGAAYIISHGNGGASADGTLTITTPADKIPNFAQTPTISSIKDGSWSDASIWNLSRVPNTTDIVGIATSTHVTIDNTDAVAKVVGISKDAKLSFSTSANTRLTAATILEYEGGALEIGTKDNPINASVKAEVVFADQAIDTVNDPRQYGTGMISLGKVTMRGDHRDVAYYQLAQEPKASSSTIVLTNAPSDWKKGDTLLLPDTRQVAMNSFYKSQAEEVTIASFSTDRKTITLTAPLQYNHLGAYDGDNKLVLLPHVAVLNRNIVFRSANPSGTRGHILMTQTADVDIEFAQFKDLGRTTSAPIDSTTFKADGTPDHIGTNQIGRYPIHFHHLFGDQTNVGPGKVVTTFHFIGNAVQNGTKWGVAIHNSHFGEVSNNVIYKMDGAGIATEDGSETGNVIDHNMIVGITGTGQNPEATGPNTEPTTDQGAEGSGIWMRSANNKVTNNVMADCKRSGMMLWTAGYDVHIPKWPGAKTHIADQVEPFTKYTHFNLDDNTTYSATRGTELWGFDHMANDSFKNTELEVRNTTVWNVNYIAIHGGGFNNPMLWNGVKAYNDPTKLKVPDISTGAPIGGGIYTTGASAAWDNVSNFVFENFSIGVSLEHGSFGYEYQQRFLDNGRLRNGVNVTVQDTDHYRNGETVFMLNNLKSEAPAGMTLHSVYWSMINGARARDQHSPRTVLLQNYQQIAGNDYQIFHGQQHPTKVRVPSINELELTSAELGSKEFQTRLIPEAGLTNTQAWDKYGKAMLGRIAPCTTQNPEVSGGSVFPTFISPPAMTVINEAYTCAFKNRTFTGVVTDQNGNGVAGAQVSLYTLNSPYFPELSMSNINKHAYPENGQHTVMQHLGEDFSKDPFRPDVKTVTDSTGHYRLVVKAVEGENVQLVATKSGFKPQSQAVASLTADKALNFAIRSGGGDGLQAHYYTDQTFTNEVASKIDTEINMDWKTREIKSGQKATANAFSARWSGEIEAPETGDYVFNISPGWADGFGSTNFARSEITVTVDGVKYIQTGELPRGTVPLVAGKRYQIAVSYVDTGNLNTSLLWSTKNMFQQVIPQGYLYSSNAIVDKPGTTSVCINLALAINNTTDFARNNISITVIDSSGNQIIKATNLSSNSSGKVTFGVPTGVTLSDSESYTLLIKARGFLNRKITGVTNLATQCYSLTAVQKLRPGGFFNDGAKITVQDIVTLIGAFNHRDDANTQIVIDTFKGYPSLSHIVSMISDFNDASRSTGDQ